METAFAGCSSAEANTFLLNQALCKDFHSIFKFSAMERYPFCAHFAVVEEKKHCLWSLCQYTPESIYIVSFYLMGQ